MKLKPEAIGEHRLEHQPELGVSVRAFGFSFNVEARGRKVPGDHERRDVICVCDQLLDIDAVGPEAARAGYDAGWNDLS